LATWGHRGVGRGRHSKRTTTTDERQHRPSDLVERRFEASAPDQPWVADRTYVKTHTGWVYVTFVIDVFRRFVVGWQTSTSLRSDLASTLWRWPSIGARKPASTG
jgi:putative transposase